jgi:hypothetical protein
MEVVLPSKLLREYKTFKRTLVTEKFDVEAVSRGVLTNKLLQFANGAIYRNEEDGSRKLVRIHEEKLQALESIVHNTQGENLLVAYSFKFDRDAILKKFPFAIDFDQDPKAYERWNAGQLRMLIAHPAMIGHGLNMQFGGRRLVWYGLPWSLELYQQMNARLPRPGQKSKNVFIDHILARGTDEHHVLASLQDKAATQESINRRVRMLI